MGWGRWDSGTWSSYKTAHVSGKPASAVFTSSDMKEAYDPAKVTVRESRDSGDNPRSTPVILAADVTGSMGMVADALLRDGLNTLATEIYDRKPVTDPHVMVMAVGDAECDRAPLQATQFEADVRLADQVRELWIERGGGPNAGESYMLAHLFAAKKTATDAWEKRRKKGYLFTIGDEPVLPKVTVDQAARFLGLQIKEDLTAEECIAMASQAYEVFHVVVAERLHGSARADQVLSQWNRLLPQRVIVLSDHTKVAETVVSAIQVNEGASKADVAASWGGGTALVVADAVRALREAGGSKGVRRLA